MSSADLDPDRSREAPALHTTTTTTTKSEATTKKKKKMLPPQEKINKIWEQFSATQFNKATTILPFAIPTHKSSPDPSTKEIPKSKYANLLVSEDFERAVQECRKRVQKLVKECRRVNMRYRDPDFDIDWDLKFEKGHCLNGLGGNKFKLYSRSDISSGPKSVKRIHEIFEKPTFMRDKISPADIRQGALGNCWHIGSLTALANMEGGIQRICVEYDTKIGIYGFVFHRDGDWIISIIDDKLYLNSPDWDSRSAQRVLFERSDREDPEKEYRNTYQTGSKALFFAQSRDQNETWLPLLEKAYAKAHGDYSALIGGWGGEGLEDLTGGVTTELLTSDILDVEEFWTNEVMKVNNEFLFGCYTGLLDGDHGNRDGIRECHAYVMMEAREISTGHRLIKLRNPWGIVKKGVWEGAWSDGSKEFTPEIQLELNHKAGNDSVFWIAYEDFLRKFQHVDRTRLFMDSPEWRITQKWISMEVPWKAEFEHKFKIILAKSSPLVIVLSQIDNRYFKGLQGQYDFRLSFRLHEIDSPDEDDYIVRSHGNYLMYRSVVTELKSIAPGTYSLFIQVVAERRSSRESVEAIVKEQTKDRSHNEKLASVGMSYDLAHSKALVHLESKAAHRKAQLEAERRKTKNTALQKQWQKRHLKRKITRKQEKKNEKKLERRKAKERLKPENSPKDQAIQTEDIISIGTHTEGSSTPGAPVDTTTELKIKPEGSEPPEDAKKCVAVNNMPAVTLDTTANTTATAIDSQKGSGENNKEGTSAHTTAATVPEAPIKTATASQVPEVVEDSKKDTSADDTSASVLETTIEAQGMEVAKKEAVEEKASVKSKTTTESQNQEAVANAEKSIPDDMSVSDDSQFSPDTPNGSSVAASPREEIGLLDSAGLSSPPQGYFPESKSSPTPLAPPNEDSKNDNLYVSSDGESSASPVSDFGDLSEDEAKPTPTTDTTKTENKDDSEKEDPEPWNAICIVGLRVYSQDEGLILNICGEGEVEENILKKEDIMPTPDNDDAGADADTEAEPSKKDKKNVNKKKKGLAKSRL